jgi:hypothetical protein
LAVDDVWWSSWVGSVVPYAVLLRQFIDGRITADEFEVIFFRLYKLDPTDWPAALFEVLDRLFADVDDYCGDSELRANVGGLDAEELRLRAQKAFHKLEELAG